jgi:hypothetical protein
MKVLGFVLECLDLIRHLIYSPLSKAQPHAKKP